MKKVPATAARLSRPRSPLLLASSLFLLTLALYARTASFSFLNYDDDVYVTENPRVLAGLDGGSLRWAFTSGHAANWHPLTWLSHMLDVEWFGLDAGKHHLASACLHALNGALLFLALRSLTRALWPSFFAAALFALHPLRIESVAWVAERKDVLSGLFWMASLWAYASWTRWGGAARYLLLLVLFALGLMAKPMLVTLPCVLLLLDAWPLGRMGTQCGSGGSPSLTPTHPGDVPRATGRGRGGYGLLLEKLPLFGLALGSALVTFRVQQAGGALGPLDTIDLEARLANGIESTVWYVQKTLWPTGLCAFYPHRGIDAVASPWTVRVLLSAALLALLTTLAVHVRRRSPGTLVGWLWFLGTLVPVIGLVQVGLQARADRYTYLPSVGLAIALVWGLLALVPSTDARRRVLAPAGLVALGALALASWRQLGTWKDSASVFSRALEVTEQNPVAHVNLGQALHEHGRLEEAAEQFLAALDLRPRLAPARCNLGKVRRAQGRRSEAAEEFQRALELDPESPEAHAELGWLLAEEGHDPEGIVHLRRAVALEPADPTLRNNLAWVLATSRSAASPAEARAIAEELCRRTGFTQPGFLETLAAALARLQRFDEAVRWQMQALASPRIPPVARPALESRLQLYRGRQPYLKDP